MLTFLLGFTIGAGFIVTRHLRGEAAILDATRAELDTERRRTARLQTALAEAALDNEIAAVQIDLLTATLAAAVSEVQTGRGGVALAEDVRKRFCWN